MKNVNIKIDLDENIVCFCKEKISEDIDVEDYIKKIVETITQEEKIFTEEISVSIMSADKLMIREYNKKYRGIDRVTDVLSFPIFTKEELSIIRNTNDEKKIKSLELGDILICLDIVEVQAVEYETGLLRELLYMITHAMCHLVGYDHIEQEEKKEMRVLEEKILNKIGVAK